MKVEDIFLCDRPSTSETTASLHGKPGLVTGKELRGLPSLDCSPQKGAAQSSKCEGL